MYKIVGKKKQDYNNNNNNGVHLFCAFYELSKRFHPIITPADLFCAMKAFTQELISFGTPIEQSPSF